MPRKQAVTTATANTQPARKAGKATPAKTQAQSIDEAFETLKAAGLLPVSIEAKPASNAELIARHTYTPAEETKKAPGSLSVTVGDCRPKGVFETTLGELNALIATTDSELSSLLCTLEPYLPSYLFQPQDDGDACKEDSDFEYRSTSGNSLSPTQVSLNNAMNELNLLRRRVIRLKHWIVL